MKSISSVLRLVVTGVVLSLVPLAAQTPGETNGVRTETYGSSDGMDFGWIGLLGLAGLFGLMRRRPETDPLVRREPGTSRA